MFSQLINYITSNAIVDKYQSAYLPHRSTETVLILIIHYIIIYLDNKAPCYLVYLYLSYYFDTLNHNILSIGLNEICIHKSTVGLCIIFHLEHLHVLGPILFIIYILPIKSLFHKYPNIHYLYADDLQIYT